MLKGLRLQLLTGKTFFLGTTYFLVVFIVFGFGGTNLNAATLTITPSGVNTTYSVGNTILASIMLDTQGQDVVGIDINNLNYNPAILSVIDADVAVSGVQITSGILFSATPINIVNTASGAITFSQTAASLGESFNGIGQVAQIEFRVVGYGVSSLFFDAVSGNTTDTNVGAGNTDVLTSATGATYTSADVQAPVLSNISAGSITTNSAVIFWNTDEPSTSQVNYGLSTAYGNTTTLDSQMVTSHSVNISGLSANTLYNFRVRSRDVSGNEATSLNRTFNTQSLPDTTSPVAVSDLSVSSADQRSISLLWTAPQDLPSGSVSNYDIRYGTAPLSESSWVSATQVTGEPVPASPGLSQAYVVVGLTPGTTYYVGIKSSDSLGNTSLLSNVLTQQTVAPPVPLEPAVTLFANGQSNISVPYNANATLSWSSTDATTCLASGAWSGAKNLNDTEVVGPLTASATYSLTCTGTGGSSVSSVVVNVVQPPQPTLLFTVDGETNTITLPQSNSGVLLEWSSTDATTCLASGAWSGAKGTSGQELTETIISTQTYTLQCVGVGGSTLLSRTVNVTSPGVQPSINLLVNGGEGPADITEGDSVVLSWSSTNATTCLASGAWSGAKNLNDTEVISNIDVDSSFTLTCSNNNGSQADSVSVNVSLPQVPTITVDILANGEVGPIGISSGGSVTLSWVSTGTQACEASQGMGSTTGDWSGAINLSGEQTISGITSSNTFVITCMNNVSELIDSVTVNILAPASGGGGGGGGSSSDFMPPNPPGNLEILGGPDQILITWINPGDADFVRIIIVRKEGAPPTSRDDGVIIYEGIDEEFTDTNVVDGITYYYALYAFDRSTNYSSSVSEASFLGQFTEQEIVEERRETDRMCIPSDTYAGITITRALFIGQRGEDVRALQVYLNAIGFTVSDTAGGSPGNETTYYGAKTQAAVQAFQCDRGIVCSGSASTNGYGRVGPRTRAALGNSGVADMCIEEIGSVGTGITITRALFIGQRGEDVRALQVYLNAIGFTVSDTAGGSPGNETTYYGAKTQAAVQAFQCDRGIVCSGSASTNGYGRVGPRTRAALGNL